MEDNQPIINKKKIIIATVAFFVIVGAVAFLLLYKGPGQSLEDQEVQFTFAKDGSKIAEIQELVNYGLTRKEYTQVFHELDTKLPNIEPSASFFYLVEESETIAPSGNVETTSDTQGESYLRDNNDPTEEIFGVKDGTEEERKSSGEGRGRLSFLMRSSGDKNYIVTVDLERNPIVVSIAEE